MPFNTYMHLHVWETILPFEGFNLLKERSVLQGNSYISSKSRPLFTRNKPQQNQGREFVCCVKVIKPPALPCLLTANADSVFYCWQFQCGASDLVYCCFHYLSMNFIHYVRFIFLMFIEMLTTILCRLHSDWIQKRFMYLANDPI